MEDRLRVLIVEDELAISIIIEIIVEETAPAMVFVHATVEGAEKAIREQDFDLAFLDVNVTNGETYKIAKVLRQNEVPISFVSSISKQEVPEELRSSPFISKPFQPADIRGAVLAAQRKKENRPPS
jgi:DNA-binding response OmpR family regulator